MASRKTSRSYDHCTNAQLAEIAHEHSTTVPSPSVPPKTLLVKCDYLEAPKTTDETSSFPFMELSPELRNGVYKQLLTFEDSRTCFPQILATSKQVNREGSGILYGDNVIEIHMISDGICVHGELISTAARNDFTGMFDECLWPRWLRRVQVVQFSLHHDLGTDVTVFGPESEDGFFDEDVDAVLKSLCSHLAPRHSLRSFRVNIRGNNTDQLLRVTPHMLHSTRLLGRLKGIQFQGDISSHDLGLQRQKSMVEAVADVWTRLKALAEFTASDKASAWSSYYLTRKISVEHWALEQCHTLDTLPEARRVQHMVGSVLRLGERVQDLAVRLNRDLMVDGRRALPDPLKYASYSACLNELVVACIGLEAAEYQAARDELERSPDLAS